MFEETSLEKLEEKVRTLEAKVISLEATNETLAHAVVNVLTTLRSRFAREIDDSDCRRFLGDVKDVLERR